MNLPTLENPALTLVQIVIIIVLTTIITRLIAFLMNSMERFHENTTAIYLIRDIINYIIYFIAIMIILQFFGINLAGTLLSLGIVGIAVSFAAKDLISNLFSGILLILERSIQTGDTVEIGKEKGLVERVSLRSTVLVDDLGVKNNIPNSTLTNSTYLLYKKPEKYRVDILTGLALNIDVEDFKKYIVSKMLEYEGIDNDPMPNVYSKGITFEETQLKVSFWVKDFNSKSDYKLIITNEIRKYTQTGEKNE